MKLKDTSFLRFEALISLLIIVSFSLTWISWGKLILSGWDVPEMYKKATKLSNAILFFTENDTPDFAYLMYIVPALALLAILSLLKAEKRTSDLIFAVACCNGISVSLYMYSYFLSSNIFNFKNIGIGIHLLFIISAIGLTYIGNSLKKKDK
ncbi:MAG: hypothetical protein RL662_347 [Bacteroidota bacterium]|jgi:hypothetical protein